MPYRPTQKTEANKQRVRKQLLECAAELFVNQGYEGTSLQQIVKAANTSIGNCYFYFPNKEAILFAIGDQLRQDVATEIDAAVAGFEVGPRRFALAVYIGVLATLNRAPIAKVALLDTAFPSIRNLTMDMFAGRARKTFTEAPALFEGWPQASPELAASAWHGSIYYVLEGVLSGRIQEHPTKVARFVARWNLQSLGLSPSVIAEALEALPESNPS